MYTYGESCYLLAELVLDEDSGGGATVHKKIPDIGPNVSLLQPLNGLFCFIDSQEASVCVQNPSTRESTPWIKSIIKQQHEDEGKIIHVIDGHGDLVKYNVAYRDYYWNFGFDPATKEHKVISLWIKQLSNRRLGRSEVWLCEVLTVRQNSWRTIDAVPPVSPISLAGSGSAYVNGSIYWLYYWPSDDPSIVEFNVGNEMFRVIQLPKFIMNDIRVPYEDGNSITEVDGHLVLLAKKICMSGNAFFTDWMNHNDSSMKMCILYNDDQIVQRKRDTGCSSSTCSDVGDNSKGNYYWMEDSFLLQPFDWKQEDIDCILPIPGTNRMIVRSSDACSFYYYNWKKNKSFSNKFRINGLNLNFAIFCFLLVAWHGYGQVNSTNFLSAAILSFQFLSRSAFTRSFKVLNCVLTMKILYKLR
ncbi:hypothetical protein MKX01_008838 [Papaver californicum]|nr:hypothetical protein MKX01_008838 [Papaver californicum]